MAHTQRVEQLVLHFKTEEVVAEGRLMLEELAGTTRAMEVMLLTMEEVEVGELVKV